MLEAGKLPSMSLSLATRRMSHKRTRSEIEVREGIGVCLCQLNLC
jgi:hypothetical protein